MTGCRCRNAVVVAVKTPQHFDRQLEKDVFASFATSSVSSGLSPRNFVTIDLLWICVFIQFLEHLDSMYQVEVPRLEFCGKCKAKRSDEQSHLHHTHKSTRLEYYRVDFVNPATHLQACPHSPKHRIELMLASFLHAKSTCSYHICWVCWSPRAAREHDDLSAREVFLSISCHREYCCRF